MTKFLLLILVLLVSTSTFSQINPRDSSVQIVTYWSLGEEQTYNIVEQKIVLSKEDTVEKTLWQYDVEVYVLDSTSMSYMVEWTTRNIGVLSMDPVTEKLAIFREGLPVVMLTNENGVLREVVNWKEMRSHVYKVDKQLHKILKHDPAAVRRKDMIVDWYESKAGIHENVIMNMMHFHTFYGTEYKLDVLLNSKLELQDEFLLDPLEAYIEAKLDSINWEERTISLHMRQWIDPERLTRSDYSRLQSQKRRVPPFDQFPKSRKESFTRARIHAPSGWIIYSEETITKKYLIERR